MSGWVDREQHTWCVSVRCFFFRRPLHVTCDMWHVTPRHKGALYIPHSQSHARCACAWCAHAHAQSTTQAHNTQNKCFFLFRVWCWCVCVPSTKHRTSRTPSKTNLPSWFALLPSLFWRPPYISVSWTDLNLNLKLAIVRGAGRRCECMGLELTCGRIINA